MTPLTLPEAFVLLLQKHNGSYYSTCDHTGAAELGELVLQHRVAFAGTKLQLLDPTPTGIGWVDEALAQLQHKAGPQNKPVAVTTFLQGRRGGRKRHCAALAQRGLMRLETQSVLFFTQEKYFPHDPTRTALVNDLHAIARRQRQLDDRSALLAALVHATGLVQRLGFDRAERQRLKEISKGQDLGAAVEQSIAAATAVITTTAVVAAVTASGS
ncbi:GOLPH3/VPS74 family protein [Saccharopolyspora hordei]|uniref:GPP34 family phosphoprotein n=1 Tax=Saccharopolyspora hordei TaxID=1838 RepID=A0A853AP29_9PSEU|nr:GPP34 family phosphoprotein [Saccharopolyspora hordei]NYI82080.1 hypothetical protein [Saccharopolyspora hordei]